MRTPIACTLLTALVCGQAAMARARAEGEQAADSQVRKCKKLPDKARIVVSLAANASLPDLANWISSLTCKNVVYSADVACRGATVLSPGAITITEALDLFNASAEAMGLKVTARGNTLVLTEARAVKCAVAPSPALPPEADKPLAPDTPGAPPSEHIVLDVNDLIKTDGTRVEVSRRLIEAFVANPDMLADSLRIVPAFDKEGKAAGFKLYAIRTSSLPAKLGFMNGDTVSAIDGVSLITVDDALDAFSRMQTASSVSVDLVRKGKPLTLEYKIR